LARNLLRFVPGPLRPAAVATAVRVLEFKHRPRIAPRQQKRLGKLPRTIVAGLFAERSGLTRGAELMLHDLQQKNADVIAVDVTQAIGHQPLRKAAAALLPHQLEGGAFDIVIHVNPPNFARALNAFPIEVLDQSRLIGFWAWELERTPQTWSRAAAYCDEIWAPSPFVVDAIGRSIDFAGPVRCVPHAVNADPFLPATPAQRESARRKLGLPADCFVMGYSFGIRSNYTRKNPMGSVRAFQRAFPSDSDAQLLLRYSDDLGLFPPAQDELRTAVAGDPRIRLLSPEQLEIAELYAAIDVYLSLHRSEGYGLPLAEAAQAGRNVIATAWGLAPDIAARPLVAPVRFSMTPVRDPQGAYSKMRDCHWAEPDIDEAAGKLIALKAHSRSKIGN